MLHVFLIESAQAGCPTSFYSPAFFSSENGYKMCLRLYLNGDYDARGTHLSLFLVIMRGEYDALITWPFSNEILFRLIDQSASNSTQYHITSSFYPDITSKCFHRPQYLMNDGYGIKRFFSIEQLKRDKHHYIVDDTMLIEVKVNELSQKPGKIYFVRKIVAVCIVLLLFY